MALRTVRANDGPQLHEPDIERAFYATQPSAFNAPQTSLVAYPPLPLDPERQQTRLLHLLPGRRKDLLRGDLRVVSLADKPKYEALSYTWGATTIGASITVNGGCPIPVTDNLYNVLRRLRRRFRTRVLWIDAICIDQCDPEERGHQVSFMGQIYNLARQVCVWLGDIDRPSRMQRFVVPVTPLWMASAVARAYFDEFYQLFPKRAVGQYFGKLIEPTFFPFSDALTVALHEAETQWYSRAWVFQELHNAQAVEWCFGPFHKSCGPKDLLSALETGLYPGTASYTRMGAQRSLLSDFGVSLGSMILHVPWEPNKRFSPPGLDECARCTRGLQATDPRDKVYSLLSIIKPEEARLVQPDYTKTCARVFTEASYASIVGSGIHGALGLVKLGTLGDETRIEGLPSWAADFTILQHHGFLWDVFVYGRVHLPIFELPPSNPILSIASYSLRLTGVLFDKVRAAAPSSQSDSEIELTPILQPLLETEYLSPTGGQGDRRDRRAYTAYGQPLRRRDMVTSSAELDLHNAVLEITQILDGKLKRLPRSNGGYFTFAEIHSLQPMMHSLLVWWTARISPNMAKDDNIVDISYGFSAFLYLDVPQTIFTTTAGFIGLALDSPLVDDVVAVFDGCKYPLLLRPYKDGYVYRGFVYVGGIKAGEFEPFCRDNGVQAQEIVLY